MDKKFRIFLVGFAVLVFLTSSCAMGPFDPPSYPVPPGSENLTPTLRDDYLKPTLPTVRTPKIKIQKPIEPSPKPIKPPKAIKVK